ncbi:MAG: hypothetical protein ACTS8H_04205 [Arsenophonus sp. NC-PE1-MAG3]
MMSSALMGCHGMQAVIFDYSLTSSSLNDTMKTLPTKYQGIY